MDVTTKVRSTFGRVLIVKKCKYIVENKEENFQLTLAGQLLEETAEYFYLSVLITVSNVESTSHEKFLSDKVFRAVGAVKGLMKNSYNRYEIGRNL